VHTRKTAEDNLSFEKFVIGASAETAESCRSEKSAMEFCRSRMLRKKSLDVSGAGLIVLAGANAGPWYE
jgi:hypothetical protein